MDQLHSRWILHLLTLYIKFSVNECITRTYYIGIKEETWNYAPSGKNLITGKPVVEDKHAPDFLQQGQRRIGSVYKKAIYKEFTDLNYDQEILKPDWLGFLGPVLRAEVDDVIVVHLKNFASRPYSLHPHGVFYEKDSEGALYPDGTTGRLKHDDAVSPGENYTYTWIVKPEYAPTDGDANCLTWVYHSHGDAPRDIYSGLIGALLTCKKGTLLQKSGHPTRLDRTDVDKDFFLMFSVVDENLSWYLEENIETFCSDPAGVDPEDKDFQKSNKMHAINGYVFGNLPGIEVCLNRNVSWHLFGMGNEMDIHSAYFHGHTVLDRGHRTDVLSLFPATFVTAEMIPRTTGKWMLSCQVNDHIQAGMQAFYQVSACGSEHGLGETSAGRIRHYYIAAEEQLWNYAPLGMDTFYNLVLNDSGSHSEVFFGTSNGRLGGVYEKVLYIGYTDDTFTTKKHRTAEEEHLGILGPIIRAETGDIIEVTFVNKAKKAYSLQPHGLQYEKTYEGASYWDDAQKNGSHVLPGHRFTYRWQVMEGPSPNDPACISYLYYSSANPVNDTSSGLIGPLLVCKKDALDESGSQKEVDREFFLLFSVMDENLSWYLKENIDRFGDDKSDPENKDFKESNKMHAVNGFMYGNLPGLELCDGERVSWHMLGLGTEVDIHGVYFQGNTFQREGMTRDTLSLFPHTAVTVTMTPDNDGLFAVTCRTSDHHLGGMRHHYSVKRCERQDVPDKTAPRSTVQYFIAAEEMEWDYSPSRNWELEKHNVSADGSPGNKFVGTGPNLIGSKYKKVVYREYTDATFRKRKARSADEQHLEILGPIIRAETGERILVNFKNNASKPYSMHAHGVKTHAGHVPIQPGGMKQYQWDVPERSGPGPSDPNCITFAYYSTADYVKDTVSGLIGPLVICREGTLDESRQRRDVHREFALLFMVFDENESWYREDNIKTYMDKPPDAAHMDDFEESNKMHAINGKLYGNLNGLIMTEGQKTNWYLLGMGNEVDIHTVHFHAQSFIYKTDHSHRADVYDLFPGTFQTVELIAGNPGEWLLHCHVTDHIHAGMEATFTILSGKASPALKSTLLTCDIGAMASLLAFVGLGLLASSI
ncbi:hephaestin-like protein 1a [Anguilla anguilla]|uniref:hephaestin-like protein 1a n=1 Tax=Anguilla anguilla TaxID=7936 RepID=UPI0015AE452C|nr:hephaestin-like protein 1a [Anguilla anguilla]